ncbi:DUF1801 domain-containing protein [Zhouia sp. PK063]|uniref:DUF1801 domain-containing protein n=1 Tax=Zhouia sp. PK063 TaxID=3373602 RepID=UPI0037B80025
MQYKATSIEDYINQVPDNRKAVLRQLCDVVKHHLPDGFEETIQYGMIAYVVPHRLYPAGYHCSPQEPLPFACIASQKNAINFYHSGLYAFPEIHQWFVNEYPKHSKYKIDMGKSCVRFKRINDIPFELIGTLCEKITVSQWIKIYESNIKKK